MSAADVKGAMGEANAGPLLAALAAALAADIAFSTSQRNPPVHSAMYLVDDYGREPEVIPEQQPKSIQR